MAKLFFQVLAILLVFGRASLIGEKVSRWSQSAIQHYVPVVPLYSAQKISIHGLIK